MKTQATSLIADSQAIVSAKTRFGHNIQRDMSGQGHAWTNIDAEDIPANIREEIEGEIIDGGVDDTDLFVGSNGIHYRW